MADRGSGLADDPNVAAADELCRQIMEFWRSRDMAALGPNVYLEWHEGKPCLLVRRCNDRVVDLLWELMCRAEINSWPIYRTSIQRTLVVELPDDFGRLISS